jgi:hypothetical protein
MRQSRNHVKVAEIDAAFGKSGMEPRLQGLIFGADRTDEHLRKLAFRRPDFFRIGAN